MLVLTRRPGESLRIGADVRVTVVSVSPGHVRIGVEAPDAVAVHREEVFERIEEANREAARAAASAPLEVIEIVRTGGGVE
ncbi:MAG: carbon storage regulator CsrA [Deltaproteobacteria bacterium]|nr:carbon storage regulator CsrA [Deltaproteobacteria bacterium]